MGCPLRNPSLFTLKLLIVLRSRIMAKSQTFLSWLSKNLQTIFEVWKLSGAQIWKEELGWKKQKLS